MDKSTGLYDRNDYYDGDGKASRLTPALNGLLNVLDWTKAFLVALKTRRWTGRSPKNLLDVGAGDGKFLFFMRRFGFTPFGTTASSISQQAARERFGINLEFTDSEIPQSLAARRYQLVTYWHVFEHLDQPEMHAASWQGLLTDDGVVILEVPNIDSIGARLAFDAWLGSDVKHHINHMTPRALDNLCSRHGFSVVRREGFSLKFTYPFLWSALLGALFGRRYDFDAVFSTLKAPFKSLLKAPVLTVNALAAVVYLAPLILPLTIWGLVSGRGEVYRVYMRRVSKAG